MTEQAPGSPRISFVMPVFNPPDWALRAAFDSLVVQTLGDWECIVVNDASTEEWVASSLDARAVLDPRFRVIHRDSNGGIAAATNTGLDAARAQLIALVDHDDVVARNAAEVVVAYFDAHPTSDLVYSDECIIDATGKIIAEFKKPDYSPVRNLGQNYLNHLVTARTDVIGELRLRTEFEPAQDFDFWLRVIEHATDRGHDVGHIAAPLYGWRIVDGSTAASATAKPAMFNSVQRCVRAAIERRELDAVAHTVQLDGAPTTQVLVEYPLPAVADITSLTVTRKVTAEMVANRLDAVTSPYAVVVPDDLVRASSGDWEQRLAAQVARPGVAAVGAVIVDPDHHILSVGRTIEPTLQDEFSGARLDAGPFGAFGVTREVAALAPWGLALDMEIYRQVGGLAPGLSLDVAVADLCSKAWDVGASVLVSPTAELVLDRSRLIDDDTDVDAEWCAVRRSSGQLVERFAAFGVADLRRYSTAPGSTSAATVGAQAPMAPSGPFPASFGWHELVGRAEAGDLGLVVVAVRGGLIVSDTATATGDDRYVAIAARLGAAGLLDASISPLDAGAAIAAARAAGAESWTQVLAKVPGVTAPDAAVAIAETVTAELDHLDGVVLTTIEQLAQAGCAIVPVARDPRPAARVADHLAELGVPEWVLSNLVCVSPSPSDSELAPVVADIIDTAGGPQRVVCIAIDSDGDVGDHDTVELAEYLGGRRSDASAGIDVAVVAPPGRSRLPLPSLAELSRRTGCDGAIHRWIGAALGAAGADSPVGRMGALTLGPLLGHGARWVADCVAYERADSVLVLGPRFTGVIAEALAVAGLDAVAVRGVDVDPLDIALGAVAEVVQPGPHHDRPPGDRYPFGDVVDALGRVMMVWPGDPTSALVDVFGVRPPQAATHDGKVDAFIADFVRRPWSFATEWAHLTERSRAARDRVLARLAEADRTGSESSDAGAGDGGRVVCVDLVTDGGLGTLIGVGRRDSVSLGLTAGPGRRGFSPPVRASALARSALADWLGYSGGVGVENVNLDRWHAVNVGLACATLGVRQPPKFDLGSAWRSELRAAALADVLGVVGGGDVESGEVLALVSDDRFDARDPAWKVPLLAVGELERFANAVDLVRSVAVANPSIESAPIAVAVGSGRPIGEALAAAARGVELASLVGFQPTGRSRVALFDDPSADAVIELVERGRVNADGWSLLTVAASMGSLGAVEFSAADQMAVVEVGLLRVKRSRSALTMVHEFASLPAPAVEYRDAVKLADHQYGQQATGGLRIAIDRAWWGGSEEHVEVAIAFRSIPATSIPAPPSSRSAATQLVNAGRARAAGAAHRVAARVGRGNRSS